MLMDESSNGNRHSNLMTSTITPHNHSNLPIDDSSPQRDRLSHRVDDRMVLRMVDFKPIRPAIDSVLQLVCILVYSGQPAYPGTAASR